MWLPLLESCTAHQSLGLLCFWLMSSYLPFIGRSCHRGLQGLWGRVMSVATTEDGIPQEGGRAECQTCQ